ncbi:hypothetical protein GW17_00047173 [Ensete ventricosum]|nr:hypothetical protein GW17_00047173 [Ensete ventricosum]
MRPAFSASILQREERSTPSYLELGQQLVGSVCRDDDVAGGGGDESLVHSLVQEGEQRVVVAVNASAWRAISAFLWCIPETALTSPTGSPVICTSQELKCQGKRSRRGDGSESILQILQATRADYIQHNGRTNQFMPELGSCELVAGLLPGAAATEDTHPSEPRGR